MTEVMAVEAIRGMGMNTMQMDDVAQVANPEAVERFQDAMEADPIPFADGLSSVWHVAQDNHQEMLHRIKALSELRGERALSVAEMSELQYEVANLSFQQEVVAKVADKASQAIQTLIKNQ